MIKKTISLLITFLLLFNIVGQSLAFNFNIEEFKNKNVNEKINILKSYINNDIDIKNNNYTDFKDFNRDIIIKTTNKIKGFQKLTKESIGKKQFDNDYNINVVKSIPGSALLGYDKDNNNFPYLVNMKTFGIIPVGIIGEGTNNKITDVNPNLEEVGNYIKENNIKQGITKVGTNVLLVEDEYIEKIPDKVKDYVEELGLSIKPASIKINYLDNNGDIKESVINVYGIYDIKKGKAIFIKDMSKVINDFNFKSENVLDNSINGLNNNNNNNNNKFSDINFMNCLTNGGAYDNNYNSITFDFTGNDEIGYSIVNTGDIKNTYKINCFSKQMNNIDGINVFSNLTILILIDNQLASLPDSIGNLSNLKELVLMNNQLTELPDSITNLNNLEAL